MLFRIQDFSPVQIRNASSSKTWTGKGRGFTKFNETGPSQGSQNLNCFTLDVRPEFLPHKISNIFLPAFSVIYEP